MKKYFSKIVFALLLAGAFTAVPASAAYTAADVKDKKSLKTFVTNAKERLEKASTVSELFAILREFRDSKKWNDGSIYLFIMQRPSGPQGGGEVVVFNAHNPSLEGTTLHVTDADGKDVGHEIDEAVYKGDGYVEYKWDNPSISGDEVGGTGKATGTSRKIGYGVNVTLFGEDFVLGSGFYPDSQSADSGKKGCAIAAATGGDSSQGATALNLLLIVSALFFAASFRKRPEEK